MIAGTLAARADGSRVTAEFIAMTIWRRSSRSFLRSVSRDPSEADRGGPKTCGAVAGRFAASAQGSRRKHSLLGRAIRAIQAAEESLESGKPADAATLQKIIEVLDRENDMQDGIAVMKKYYSEEAWERHKRYYEEGPSPEWRQLYRDTEVLIGTDPGSEPAQALVERWFELSRRAYTGDPEVQTDSPTAWMDREHWPPVMKQRMAEFKVEEATAFIKLAALSSRKKYFSEDAWAKLLKRFREQSVSDHSRMWQARVDLFRDIEKALLRDPAGETAQALVARWRAQLDEASGGDSEIKTALLHGWTNRRRWPPSVRWQVEALHMMNFERFERAADFLDRAAAFVGALT